MFWQISAVIIAIMATGENSVDQNDRVVENSRKVDEEVSQTAWNDADTNVGSITPTNSTQSANASYPLRLNGTECDSEIPHCELCETTGNKHCKYCRRDELQRESLDGMCVDCGDQVNRNNYWEDRNASDWQCLQCEWGYAVNNYQSQCVACREAIDNCTECSNQEGEIVCSLCDDGFYVGRDNNVEKNTSCKACDTTIDNCDTCEFEWKKEDSTKLVCTKCHFGFYFDYYRNCSACNETMPRCTNCSSFEACQIFGPVQNLTCYDCEDDHYVAEDQASCNIDCRNISSLCKNCTLGEEGECLACYADAYMNDSGKCQTCRKAIDNCTECSNQEGEIVCSLCDDGFYVDQDNDVDKNPICKACHGRTEHHRDTRESSDNVRMACGAGFVSTDEQREMWVCGAPPPPPYRGGYAFTGIQYSDTVTYDCECGYDLVGDQVLTCDKRGQWGQPPCCIRKMLGLTLVTLSLLYGFITDEKLVAKLETLGDSVNVRELYIDMNMLTKVPPLTQYRQLDTLHTVSLSSNNIINFIWEDFPARTEDIDLQANKLMVLPVLGQYDFCLNVKALHLSHNKLVSIRNEQIPLTVEILDLFGNNLVEVSDLSHCKHLSILALTFDSSIFTPLAASQNTLKLSYDQLSSLVNMTHLVEIRISGMNMSSVRTEYLPPSLTDLRLNDNRITNTGDLRHLDKLRELHLKRNQLTKIPPLLPPRLTVLSLSKNRITEFGDLRHLDKLRELHLKRNQLAKIPPLLPPSLTYLSLSKNRITEFGDLRHLDKPTIRYLTKNNLTTIPPLFPPNLIRLDLDRNRITEIGDLRYLDKLIALDVSDNQLTTIPPLFPPNLTWLHLGGNKITQTRDWRHLDKVTALDLSGNQLTTIPPLFPPNLTRLFLGGNRITRIGDLRYLDKLTALYLSNNQLTTIPPLFPPNLTVLYLDGNRITRIGDLRYLDKLTSLYLYNNQLTTIPPLFPPNLTVLYLGGNRITRIGDLRYLDKLTALYLYNNQLTTIPMFLPSRLTALDLRNNMISDWSNVTLLEKNYPKLFVHD